MVNPLRLPAVLVVVFALMLLYVHSYHRRHAELNEATVPIRDHLQLRQSASELSSSDYRNATMIDVPPPQDTEVKDSESAARSPLPLPAPDVPVATSTTNRDVTVPRRRSSYRRVSIMFLRRRRRPAPLIR